MHSPAEPLARVGKDRMILCPVVLAALTWSALLLLVGTVTVHAEGVTIEAAFSYAVPGLSVTFEDRSEGVLIAWSWSFGDPSGKVSSEKNPSHEYTTSGKYTVTLRITDASGIQDQVSKTIRLGSTDRQTLSLGSGAIITVAGLILLFRGEDNVKLAGLVVLVVGVAFPVSLVTERDIVGRLLDLFLGG
jgi:hypothetical protein